MRKPASAGDAASRVAQCFENLVHARLSVHAFAEHRQLAILGVRDERRPKILDVRDVIEILDADGLDGGKSRHHFERGVLAPGELIDLFARRGLPPGELRRPFERHVRAEIPCALQIGMSVDGSRGLVTRRAAGRRRHEGHGRGHAD